VQVAYQPLLAWRCESGKLEGPFIPRLKPGAFWLHFCKLGEIGEHLALIAASPAAPQMP
jgi:hypothetical protein